MKKVLINVTFNDRYTGKKHIAGKTEEMTEERIAEIKEVNPNFISVVGKVEQSAQDNKEKSKEKADKEKSKNKDNKEKSTEK